MIDRIEASGLKALGLASELLHRVRLAHPTAGVWEAADVQWWWRTPRTSDAVPKTFWLDDDGPVAAALLTTWREAWGLDPIVVPGTPAPTRAEVVDDGLARATALGIGRIETQVRDDDPELQRILADRGFAAVGAGGVTWLPASARRRAPPIPVGFELIDRSAAGAGPHPMERRNGPEVAERLRQVPLYDPGLDLALLAPTGEIAGYALLWFDPRTLVGMLEPMRVEDAWQRRGLARTLLLHGLERLAHRGATRFKVSYETEPARALYTGAGFEVESTDTAWFRQAR